MEYKKEYVTNCISKFDGHFWLKLIFVEIAVGGWGVAFQETEILLQIGRVRNKLLYLVVLEYLRYRSI